MEDNIEKTLMLSTGHIKLSTKEFLEETHPEFPFRYQSHEYGFLFFISPTIEHESLLKENAFFRTHGMEELIPILFIARSNECTMVNIDQDGNSIYPLEEFDW